MTLKREATNIFIVTIIVYATSSFVKETNVNIIAQAGTSKYNVY